MARKTLVTLAFDPSNDADQKKFELLYSGFIAGGNLSQESGIDNLTSRVEIVRAFKAISADPEGEGRPRTLLTSDGPVVATELSQDEFKMLRRYILACPFRVEVAERVLELVEWLDQCEKAELARPAIS